MMQLWKKMIHYDVFHTRLHLQIYQFKGGMQTEAWRSDVNDNSIYLSLLLNFSQDCVYFKAPC